MAFKVTRALGVRADLEAIYDHLFESYLAFGDDVETARDRAERRVAGIDAEFDFLARMPFQGTLRPNLGPQIRNVTKDNAVIYFRIDEAGQHLVIEAVFFGGQDHQTAMLKRLRS